MYGWVIGREKGEYSRDSGEYSRDFVGLKRGVKEKNRG